MFPKLTFIHEDNSALSNLTIHPSFDPTLEAHTLFPAPTEPGLCEEWTSHERIFAEKAFVVAHLNDFRNKVCEINHARLETLTLKNIQLADMYPQGIKHSKNEYIRVPMEALEGYVV